MGHMGGLINPRPGREQYRAGFSNTSKEGAMSKNLPYQVALNESYQFKTIRLPRQSIPDC